MTTQPDALRLAEYHECAEDLHSIQTAAELRRLAEVEGEWMALSQDQGKLEGQIDRLVAQRDELLEALKGLVMFPLGTFQVKAARAAIAKAEQNT